MQRISLKILLVMLRPKGTVCRYHGEKERSIMFQAKLAARLTLPLALLCSVAVAQDQQPANCVIKTPEQPKPQIQASVLANDETYGSFVAYKGPPLKPTPAPAAESAQPTCTTNDQAANNSSSQQASLKTQPKDEAYGSYVPYKG